MALSTDWICSRLACTQEAERLQAGASNHAETRLHTQTPTRHVRALLQPLLDSRAG